ncbi:MAG: GtrA family protein [Spirochaetales bacterium]|nr:GtrA family protein [Spirochaetales bacterium]
MLKFFIVGLSGSFVNLSIVWLGNLLFTKTLGETYGSVISIALAIIISIFSNYVLNYLWTWKDRRLKESAPFFSHLLKYYLASLVSAGLQFLIAAASILFLRKFIFLSCSELPIFWKLSASFSGILFASVVNFFANHLWTFAVSDAKESL